MIRALLKRFGNKLLAWVVVIALGLAVRGGVFVFQKITGRSLEQRTAVETDDDGDEAKGTTALAPTPTPVIVPTTSPEFRGTAPAPETDPSIPAPKPTPTPTPTPATTPALPPTGTTPVGIAPPKPEEIMFPGSAPVELQLPDATMRELRRPTESWVFAWRIGLGTFRLDQLERKVTRPLPSDQTTTYNGNAYGEDLRLLHLAIPSPEATRLVDPHLDIDLVARGEGIVARRTRTAGVEYIDLKRRTSQRVLSGGEGTRFDGAHWIDGDRFVVFAAERREGPEWLGGPSLYLVNLAEKTITRYDGPAGDQEAWERVRLELERRFRAERPALAVGHDSEEGE